MGNLDRCFILCGFGGGRERSSQREKRRERVREEEEEKIEQSLVRLTEMEEND
jgi:hypothetical protein